MHVLSETWVMSRSIQAEKSGLEPKPTSLLQPVTWVTGKEIGLELGQIGLAYFAAPMRGSSYLASNVRRVRVRWLPITANRVMGSFTLRSRRTARQTGCSKSANAVRRKGAPGP